MGNPAVAVSGKLTADSLKAVSKETALMLSALSFPDTATAGLPIS